MPYKLHVSTYGSRKKPVIVLFHGLNTDSGNWTEVVGELKADFRVVALDLLGFGQSPKPDYIDYDPQDHIRSIHYSLTKQKIDTPFILVGHSMGAVLAMHYASTYGSSVNHIILCSLPFYKNNQFDSKASGWRATISDKTLLYIYDQLLRWPNLTIGGAQFLQMIKRDRTLYNLNKDSWYPFAQSLRNTIEAPSLGDIARSITIPVDIVYGKADPLMNTANLKMFARANKNVHLHEVRSSHDISSAMSKKICDTARGIN